MPSVKEQSSNNLKEVGRETERQQNLEQKKQLSNVKANKSQIIAKLEMQKEKICELDRSLSEKRESETPTTVSETPTKSVEGTETEEGTDRVKESQSQSQPQQQDEEIQKKNEGKSKAFSSSEALSTENKEIDRVAVVIPSQIKSSGSSSRSIQASSSSPDRVSPGTSSQSISKESDTKTEIQQQLQTKPSTCYYLTNKLSQDQKNELKSYFTCTPQREMQLKQDFSGFLERQTQSQREKIQPTKRKSKRKSNQSISSGDQPEQTSQMLSDKNSEIEERMKELYKLMDETPTTKQQAETTLKDCKDLIVKCAEGSQLRAKAHQLKAQMMFHFNSVKPASTFHLEKHLEKSIEICRRLKETYTQFTSLTQYQNYMAYTKQPSVDGDEKVETLVKQAVASMKAREIQELNVLCEGGNDRNESVWCFWLHLQSSMVESGKILLQFPDDEECIRQAEFDLEFQKQLHDDNNPAELIIVKEMTMEELNEKGQFEGEFDPHSDEPKIKQQIVAQADLQAVYGRVQKLRFRKSGRLHEQKWASKQIQYFENAIKLCKVLSRDKEIQQCEELIQEVKDSQLKRKADRQALQQQQQMRSQEEKQKQQQQLAAAKNNQSSTSLPVSGSMNNFSIGDQNQIQKSRSRFSNSMQNKPITSVSQPTLSSMQNPYAGKGNGKGYGQGLYSGDRHSKFASGKKQQSQKQQAQYYQQQQQQRQHQEQEQQRQQYQFRQQQQQSSEMFETGQAPYGDYYGGYGVGEVDYLIEGQHQTSGYQPSSHLGQHHFDQTNDSAYQHQTAPTSSYLESPTKLDYESQSYEDYQQNQWLPESKSTPGLLTTVSSPGTDQGNGLLHYQTQGQGVMQFDAGYSPAPQGKVNHQMKSMGQYQQDQYMNSIPNTSKGSYGKGTHSKKQSFGSGSGKGKQKNIYPTFQPATPARDSRSHYDAKGQGFQPAHKGLHPVSAQEKINQADVRASANTNSSDFSLNGANGNAIAVGASACSGNVIKLQQTHPSLHLGFGGEERMNNENLEGNSNFVRGTGRERFESVCSYNSIDLNQNRGGN